MPSSPTSAVLTLAHSPDPDDAFMWWPLGDAEQGREPEIDTRGFRFTTVASDIESLNTRAITRGDLDITAVSAHCYPHIKDRYAFTACGASMGDGYGPKLVALERHDHHWLTEEGVTTAVPGEKTSAFLTLRLMLGKTFRYRVVDFEKIIDEVRQGRAQAGLVIHEGQLTFEDHGLVLLEDLGAWWKQHTGLPLPLGANVVRRDIETRLGPGSLQRLASVLRDSVRHAMREHQKGLGIAMGYGRGISEERADRFVRLYVNDLTVDMGELGREALQKFLFMGASAGLCPDPGPIDVVTPSD